MPPTVAADGALAGVILAGGRSRRMGGAAKALVTLATKPLLSHVIERVNPQVNELFLSVEKSSQTYARFGLPQLEDARPDGGPLGGLLAAMQRMGQGFDWLLLVPCDAPFVPTALASGLLECALQNARPAAVVCYRSEIQPTFSIWNRVLLPRLEHAVDVEGMAGLKQFLRATEFAELNWPCSDPSPFFNINDQAALQMARDFLDPALQHPAMLKRP